MFLFLQTLSLEEPALSQTHERLAAQDVTVEHEASVSRIGQEQLFYLMSRGLTEEQASALIVSGFLEPIIKNLPLEYAVEMNRMIALEMEGSVG